MRGSRGPGRDCGEAGKPGRLRGVLTGYTVATNRAHNKQTATSLVTGAPTHLQTHIHTHLQQQRLLQLPQPQPSLGCCLHTLHVATKLFQLQALSQQLHLDLVWLSLRQGAREQQHSRAELRRRAALQSLAVCQGLHIITGVQDHSVMHSGCAGPWSHT